MYSSDLCRSCGPTFLHRWVHIHQKPLRSQPLSTIHNSHPPPPSHPQIHHTHLHYLPVHTASSRPSNIPNVNATPRKRQRIPSEKRETSGKRKKKGPTKRVRVSYSSTTNTAAETRLENRTELDWTGLSWTSTQRVHTHVQREKGG